MPACQPVSPDLPPPLPLAPPTPPLVTLPLGFGLVSLSVPLPQKWLHLLLLCLLWLPFFRALRSATSCRNSCCCFGYFLVIVRLVYAVGVPTMPPSCPQGPSLGPVSDTQFKFMPVYNHCLPVIKPWNTLSLHLLLPAFFLLGVVAATF